MTAELPYVYCKHRIEEHIKFSLWIYICNWIKAVMLLAVGHLNTYVCLFILGYLTTIHGIDSNTKTVVCRVKGGDIVTFTNPSMNCTERDCSRLDAIRYCGSNCSRCSSTCCCRCKSESPTFLPQEGKCVNSSHILGDLKTKDKSKCTHWLSIDYKANGSKGYTRKMIDVINLRCSRSVDLKYNKSKGIPEHYNCGLNKQHSSYLTSKGAWLRIKESCLNQYMFKIASDNNTGLTTIHWTAFSDDSAETLNGKVLNLKLRCTNTAIHTKSENFCITLKTEGLDHINASSNRLTTTSYPRPVTRINTTENFGTGGKTSGRRVVIITVVVLLTIVLLAMFAVAAFVRRRKISRKLTMESENAELNPTYEKGPDASIVVQDPALPKRRKKVKEESNDYQPLVQNTVIRDGSGRRPVYQSLVKDESTGSHPQDVRELCSVTEYDLGNGKKDSNYNQNTIQSNGSSDYCQPYSYKTIAGISKPPPLYHELEGPTERSDIGQELYRQHPVYRVLEGP